MLIIVNFLYVQENVHNCLLIPIILKQYRLYTPDFKKWTKWQRLKVAESRKKDQNLPLCPIQPLIFKMVAGVGYPPSPHITIYWP